MHSEVPCCTLVLTRCFMFCILMPWHLGPCWFWRDCPSQSSPIPNDRNELPLQACQSLYPNYRLYQALHIWPLSSCPNHSRPSTWQLWELPKPQSPLQLASLPIPNLLILLHLYLPPSNQDKGSCAQFLLPSSASWCTRCLTLWPTMVVSRPLLWGTVNNKLSFQWQLAPDPWPYHTSDCLLIHYILKQPVYLWIPFLHCLHSRHILETATHFNLTIAQWGRYSCHPHFRNTKPRHRKGKVLASGHTASKCWAGMQTHALWLRSRY